MIFKSLNKLYIPATSGKTSVQDFFPNMVVRCDPLFQTFLDQKGENSFRSNEALSCELLQPMGPSEFLDNEVCNFGHYRHHPYRLRDRICAVLSFLGKEENKSLLEIPKDADEMNIILGYATLDPRESFVLYLEHEFENGSEEIHLHMREMNQWGNETPYVLMVIS